MLLQMALFHSFNGWVLFYCVCRIYTYIHTCIPHLLYTFICRWTFSLCPCRSSGHSLSHVWLFVAPWLQDTRLPSPSTTPGTCSNSHPLSQWCHPTISSSVTPSFPPLNLSQHQGLFQRVGSSHQVAKMLVLQLQHWSSHLSFPLQLKLTFLGKTSLTSSPTLLESSFIVTNSSSVLPD